MSDKIEAIFKPALEQVLYPGFDTDILTMDLVEEARLEGRKAELQQQLRQAWKSLELARLQVEALSEGVLKEAESALKVAQAAYRFGERGILDVLDAQRRYFDAQIGLSNSVRDEHLALVQLYKALGGGWTE